MIKDIITSFLQGIRGKRKVKPRPIANAGTDEKGIIQHGYEYYIETLRGRCKCTEGAQILIHDDGSIETREKDCSFMHTETDIYQIFFSEKIVSLTLSKIREVDKE